MNSDLIALFFSALVSSTLFPGGSEALLYYLLHEGDHAVPGVVTVATAGNVAGSVITYGMGFYTLHIMKEKRERKQLPSWLCVPDHRQAQAERYFQRYGAASLLFAWLPVIGDPLCFIAGAMQFPRTLFVVLIGIGKAARYSAIAWLV